MRIELNTDKLKEIERKVPGAAALVVQKLAQDTQAYIGENWSQQSPSAPGEPPGVDTGTLKNNIVAQPAGKLTWEVLAGTEYAAWLEFGTTQKGSETLTRMAARPFLLPAVEAIAENTPPDLLREVVEG